MGVYNFMAEGGHNGKDPKNRTKNDKKRPKMYKNMQIFRCQRLKKLSMFRFIAFLGIIGY